MSRLIIATHNKGKANEFRAILAPYYSEIITLNELGLNESIAETEDTFVGNALLKANYVANLVSNCDVLADDSGLCVDALNGAPSVHSARYANEHATDSENRAVLLKNMIGIKNRKAHFETHLALILSNGTQLTACGTTQGEIIHEERGSNGFGYDSLFYSYDLGKTFAESSDAEKNSVSHRSRAIANLLLQLNK